MRPASPLLAVICCGALAGAVRCVPLAIDTPLTDAGSRDAREGDVRAGDSDASGPTPDSGLGLDAGTGQADAPDGIAELDANPTADAGSDARDSAGDATAPDDAESRVDSALPLEGAADAPADGCAFAGLEAYYPLNGDTADHSANSGYATVTNTAFVDGGKLGELAFVDGGNLGELALLFPEDDGDAGVTFAINEPQYEFTGGGTMCAWFDALPLTDPNPVYGLPLFVAGPTYAGDFFSVQTQNSEAPWCGMAGEIFHDHWGGSCDDSNVVAPTQHWNYVCIAFLPAAGPVLAHVDVFLNGFVTTMSAPVYTWDLSQVTVGSSTIGGTSTRPSFVGTINEVSIWNRGLGLSEMEALYSSGQGCKPRP
jgi:hypothetical protein